MKLCYENPSFRLQPWQSPSPLSVFLSMPLIALGLAAVYIDMGHNCSKYLIEQGWFVNFSQFVRNTKVVQGQQATAVLFRRKRHPSENCILLGAGRFMKQGGFVFLLFKNLLQSNFQKFSEQCTWNHHRPDSLILGYFVTIGSFTYTWMSTLTFLIQYSRNTGWLWGLIIQISQIFLIYSQG